MKKPHWSDVDRDFIRDNWRVMSDEQLAAFLPGRTAVCVETKRQRMGLIRKRPITTTDIRRVQSDIARHTAREIGEDIGRTEVSIWDICARFDIDCHGRWDKSVAA